MDAACDSLDTADEPRRDPDLKAWAEACLREPFTFQEVQSVQAVMIELFACTPNG